MGPDLNKLPRIDTQNQTMHPIVVKMSSKRPRIDSSGNLRLPKYANTNSSAPSSATDTSPTPPTPQCTSGPKFRMWSISGDQPTATRVSPAAGQRGSNGATYRLCQFLERCSLCHNSIAPKRNIFMYMSCAFCSVECRATQISIDEIIIMGRRKEELEGRPGQYSGGPRGGSVMPPPPSDRLIS